MYKFKAKVFNDDILIGESVDGNVVRFYDVTPDYTIHLFTIGTTNDMSIKNF